MNRKKILFYGAFFAALLMVSTGTAVNVSHYKAIDEQVLLDVVDDKITEVDDNEDKKSDCPLCYKEGRDEAIKDLRRSIMSNKNDLNFWGFLFDLIMLLLLIPLCLIFPFPCCSIGCTMSYNRCIDDGKDPDLCDLAREICYDGCADLL